MAGINLSSGTFEQKTSHRSIADSSLTLSTILFLLVAAGWGGMRWYISTLDGKLANLEATIQENATRLQGSAVDRVAHFATRLDLIGKQLDQPSIDSQALLTQLESLTVPNVRLTRYEYNDAEKVVEVAGETDNFKYVAQQIISLKSESLFSGITVDSIDRTKEGNIAFSLKAQL